MINRPKSHRVRPGRGHVSLARAISKHGVGSRSQARAFMEKGRVSVNGSIVRDPDRWVDPRVDRITIDGIPLRKRDFVYLAMHKPAGIVTSRSDEKGRRTVYDLLPDKTSWVFPIGRLDKESSGLLLLTNDTRFGESIAGPDGHVTKTYQVRLDTGLSDQDAQSMESGMKVGDVRYRPARIEMAEPDRTVCRIVLTEGRNRQIRKMLAHLGYRVLSLCRIGIGAVRLGDLKEGAVRRLSATEVRSLMDAYATEGPR